MAMMGSTCLPGVPGQSVWGILQAAGRTPVPRPVTPHTVETGVGGGARRAEGQAVAANLTCRHEAQAGQRVGRVRLTSRGVVCISIFISNVKSESKRKANFYP